jgi:glucokinase
VILAGDVGGTKTTLALFADGRLVREATLASRDFGSLEAAIARFLGADPRAAVAALAVGIAGPVVDGRCTTTNLPWQVDERALAAAVPVPRARLINDLEATAHGVFALAEHELVTLQSGTPRRGNMAVIAAGTGLGEALVIDDGVRRTVVASEGGHADFGPRGELEEGLLRFLRLEFGRVSYERVLSGPGLTISIAIFVRRASRPSPARSPTPCATRIRASSSRVTRSPAPTRSAPGRWRCSPRSTAPRRATSP